MEQELLNIPPILIDLQEAKDATSQANLRYFEWNGHCTLSFLMQLEGSEQYEPIKEIVVAVRQMTETVGALLKHTYNKMQKIHQNHLKSECDKENKADFGEMNLQLSLLNRGKEVLESTELKYLQKCKQLSLTVMDRTLKVIVNVPFVECIKLPEVIYSGHAVQPSQFKAVLANQEQSRYFWYKSIDKHHWILVGSDYHYAVTKDDNDHFIKFVYLPINVYSQGEPYEVVSNSKVCVMPTVPYCPFQDRHNETPTFLTGNQFRVVSYNTLSCRYANEQFSYCPIEYLAIDYRKQLLLKELFGYNADVICCQEVDNKIYSFYFRPEFQKINYGSIYNKKGNRIPEGLAIFYNKSRFGFAGHGHIVFSTEVKANRNLRNVLKLVESDSDVCETFMKQPTSMQYLLLKSRNSNQLLIVANTHLFYHPEASNVRLLQTAACMEFLKVIYTKESKKYNGASVSLIFCGDFNSVPESDVYNYLVDGAIQYNSKSIGTSLFHRFQLTSACGTPQFTNYVDDFKACLDYIFYANLKCTRFIDFPREEILQANTALPSRVFPSDHIALIADFKFN